ncbi:MAG: sigma-70 family RNA polymerase sigma factor [Flavobacteriales bacterium]|nr:sigma-70 family RNA polymerase sigma factor [Flavobacteriales bacterium]MCC6936807.1 sigma-70 family RNA polymerase sigma factor [Flavobacteriales bacterium]
MVNDTLIARCAREEPKAQYELYRALYPQMMAICSRYERNKQDAVARMNQGFLKILTNIDKRRPDVPFELWTRRIMINTVIDDFRTQRQRKEQESLDAPLEESVLTEVNDYLREMEADAFATLLERVPEMSRKVFNLFAIDGYAHQEIADLLGISTGTSKWHVSHARQVLQHALAQQMGVTAKTASR